MNDDGDLPAARNEQVDEIMLIHQTACTMAPYGQVCQSCEECNMPLAMASAQCMHLDE